MGADPRRNGSPRNVGEPLDLAGSGNRADALLDQPAGELGDRVLDLQDLRKALGARQLLALREPVPRHPHPRERVREERLDALGEAEEVEDAQVGERCLVCHAFE